MGFCGLQFLLEGSGSLARRVLFAAITLILTSTLNSSITNLLLALLQASGHLLAFTSNDKRTFRRSSFRDLNYRCDSLGFLITGILGFGVPYFNFNTFFLKEPYETIVYTFFSLVT